MTTFTVFCIVFMTLALGWVLADRILQQLGYRVLHKDELKTTPPSKQSLDERADLYLQFKTFLDHLIEDAESEAFQKRFPTQEAQQEYYKDSLKYLLEITHPPPPKQ